MNQRESRENNSKLKHDCSNQKSFADYFAPDTAYRSQSNYFFYISYLHT